MSVQMYQSAKPLEALHPLQRYPQQTLILHAGNATVMIHSIRWKIAIGG